MSESEFFQITGFSIEGVTQRLIAAYFEICSCLLCILFAAFPSPVYRPSVSHNCLFEASQMPIIQILLRTLKLCSVEH